MSKFVPGYPIDQVGLLDVAGDFLGGGPVGYVKAYTRLSHPRAIPSLRTMYRPVRGAYRVMWRVMHPRTWWRPRRRVIDEPVESAVDDMELL